MHAALVHDTTHPWRRSDAPRAPIHQVPAPDSTVTANTLPASVILSGCSLDGNSAGSDGGGASLDGGRTVFVSGDISNNVAGADGGGISIKARQHVSSSCPFLCAQLLRSARLQSVGQAMMRTVSVAANVAAGNGGGIVFQGSNSMSFLALFGGMLSGNDAAAGGGAIYLAWPAYTLDGAAMTNNTAYTARAKRCTAQGSAQGVRALDSHTPIPCAPSRAAPSWR